MTVPTVFISSTVTDLTSERDAAERAISSIGFRAVRAEKLGSRSYAPHEACLEMVRSSDVYLGIYGRRYGWIHPDLGVSATELELLEARRQFKHLLVYIKDEKEREPEQTDFVSRVQDFDRGIFTRPNFESLDQLVEWIREDLVVLTGRVFSISAYCGSVLPEVKFTKHAAIGTRSRPVYITLVPSIGENDYVTRHDVLDRIEHYHEHTRDIVLVQGIGGSGKTIVALAYANLPRYSKRYKSIAWVNASGNFVDAMINDLHKPLCGSKCDLIGDRDADYRSVLREMLASPGRNLLVVDGADRPNDMSRHLVQLTLTRWDILVTSRCKIADFAMVTVDDMAISDAKKLFRRFCAKTHTDESLLNLIEAVGRHAYLVELSSKLIARKTNLTVENCIGLLNGPQVIKSVADGMALPAEPLVIDGKPQDMQHRLISLLAFDELDSEERKLVRWLSLLPSVSLDFERLETLFLSEGGDRVSFRSTIHSLNLRGWVRVTDQSLRIHPLAQAIANLRALPDVDNCATIIRSIQNLSTFRDVDITRPVDWIPYCETLFARISGRSLELAALASRTALLLEGTGEFEKAIQYHLFSLDIRLEFLGPLHPDTATSMDETGLCWLFIGNLKLAEAKVLSGLEARTKLLDPDDADLAASWNNLGFVSRRLGRLEEALKFYQKALSIYSHQPLASFAQSLTCNNISVVYRDLKNIDMALEFAFSGLQIRQSLLREDHPSFGNSYNSIALLLLEKGEPAAAVEFALKSVKFREAVLPPLHPDTAIALHTLARVCVATGDEVRAQQSMGQALHIFRQSLRPDHPLVIRAMADAATMRHAWDLRSG